MLVLIAICVLLSALIVRSRLQIMQLESVRDGLLKKNQNLATLVTETETYVDVLRDRLAQVAVTQTPIKHSFVYHIEPDNAVIVLDEYLPNNETRTFCGVL